MKPKRILIADDEPHMIRVITQFLERAGYQVQIVRNGQKALDAIRESPPDLLLTDIQMPNMTGEQLCEALQREMPERTFPIMVMTSMTDIEHRQWTAAMRNTTFLEKPLSMRKLIVQLDQLFADQQAGAGGDNG